MQCTNTTPNYHTVLLNTAVAINVISTANSFHRQDWFPTT